MKRSSFFSPSSYKLSKEKQVRLLKIDFQREHIFQVFGAFALRQFSLRLRHEKKVFSFFPVFVLTFFSHPSAFDKRRWGPLKRALWTTVQLTKGRRKWTRQQAP
jgi:hypothetical protein